MEYLFRFSNLIKLTNINVDKLWHVVKKLKRDTSLDKTCSLNDLYDDNEIIESQVLTFEKYLVTKSSEQRLANMNAEDLQSAAEMFIYLNMCPGEYNKEFQPYGSLQKLVIAWFTFYEDLLKNKSLDIILLTLNRLMKNRAFGEHEMKMTRNVFNKARHLMKLENDINQRQLPGRPVNISRLEFDNQNIDNFEGKCTHKQKL